MGYFNSLRLLAGARDLKVSSESQVLGILTQARASLGPRE